MHFTKLSTISVTLVLTVLLSLALSTAAFADSTTATLSIAAGSLSETTASPSSISTTLNGVNQIPTYDLPITSIDSSGTGAGWNMSITSTLFCTAGCIKALAPTASSIVGVTASCAGGATCTSPANSVSYPVTVPAGTTAPPAAKFFNATANTGMGRFTLDPTVAVSIPSNTTAGTYTSTITLAITAGP